MNPITFAVQGTGRFPVDMLRHDWNAEARTRRAARTRRYPR